MFVHSNLVAGISTSPPQTKEQGKDDSQAKPEQHYEEMIRAVIRAACNRRGGLSLRIGRRGHQPVSEEVIFKKGDFTDVQVRQDFSFVLIFRGQRFWVQSKTENCDAIRSIRDHLDSPKEFQFPDTVSFSTGA